MGENKKTPKPGARVALLNVVPDANKERIAAIKQWHIDQAIGDTKPVALLNIAITAAGDIVTHGVHLEPEHAQAMIPELDRIKSSINAQLRPAKAVVKMPLPASAIPPEQRQPISNLFISSLLVSQKFQCWHCNDALMKVGADQIHYQESETTQPKPVVLCPSCKNIADHMTYKLLLKVL